MTVLCQSITIMEYVEKMELELESEHFLLYEENRHTYAKYVLKPTKRDKPKRKRKRKGKRVN